MQYRLASNKDPMNPMYMNNLADTFRLNGQLDEALRVLNDSLKLDSSGMGTHFNLGMVYKDLKENTKALESFKQSIQVNAPLTEAYYQTALIHLKLKNREEALKFINKALEFSPNNLNYQESRDTILNS
jgi:tetratricopeptide (TPR) repeat protein